MTCPICAKATDARYRPFCSKRCADIDLGRWLNESYRVPAGPEDDAASDAAEQDANPPAPPQPKH